VGAVALVALAVIAFFSFRQRRIRMLDQDPESLFDNREILLGPAADRIADAVALGDVTRTDGKRAEGRRADLRHQDALATPPPAANPPANYAPEAARNGTDLTTGGQAARGGGSADQQSGGPNRAG